MTKRAIPQGQRTGFCEVQNHDHCPVELGRPNGQAFRCACWCHGDLNQEVGRRLREQLGPPQS